jgi:hypothetical protein
MLQQQLSVKSSYTKFHENPTDGRTWSPHNAFFFTCYISPPPKKDHNSKHKGGLMVRQLHVVTGTVTTGINNFYKNLGANSKFQEQEG